MNDLAYQTSPSSDESSATQAPAFNINPGTKAIKKKPATGSSDTIIQKGPSQEVATDNPDIPDEPALQDDPPHQDITVSPAHASPPLIHQEKEDMVEEQPAEKAQDEVVVTGENQTLLPETSATLTKIRTKAESPIKNKGKAALHFQYFEDQDINSLHQSVLNRLSESRDTEIAMVTSLKQKYEVIPIT